MPRGDVPIGSVRHQKRIAWENKGEKSPRKKVRSATGRNSLSLSRGGGEKSGGRSRKDEKKGGVYELRKLKESVVVARIAAR